MYTGHYADRIPKVRYTSVYLSVHIEYTGSLYLLIQAISCSDIVSVLLHFWLHSVVCVVRLTIEKCCVFRELRLFNVH